LKIEAIEFVCSATELSQVPVDGKPEVPLVGRSNVGKSTLINAIGSAQPARAGRTPGTTRVINYYRARMTGSRTLYLVDLPGYGYASGRREDAAGFDRLTRDYFTATRPGHRRPGPVRAPIAAAILTVDSRHPGLASDLAACTWLQTLGVPVLVVATKADKLSQAERAHAERQWKAAFRDPVLAVSAVDGEGLDDLRRMMFTWAKNHRA
jgi:GTP-binding protein